MSSGTTTDYPSIAIATEILDHINNLQNSEVTEASAHKIAIAVRTLTDQCNARYLKNIQVDGIYTPTNVFPTEIKSWYFTDLNYTNIQKYIIETFENLERNSYNTEIEASNRCVDTIHALVDYINLVLFSRLAHRIKLRQKILDDCSSSSSVETSNLVTGDDF